MIIDASAIEEKRGSLRSCAVAALAFFRSNAPAAQVVRFVSHYVQTKVGLGKAGTDVPLAGTLRRPRALARQGHKATTGRSGTIECHCPRNVGALVLASAAMPPAYRYREAVHAMCTWVRAHGRLPRERDWERAEQGRPCARTVRRRWGWYELMADALDLDLAEI